MINIEEAIYRGYCNNYQELEEYVKTLEKYGRINSTNITFTDWIFSRPIEFEISYTPYEFIDVKIGAKIK